MSPSRRFRTKSPIVRATFSRCSPLDSVHELDRRDQGPESASAGAAARPWVRARHCGGWNSSSPGARCLVFRQCRELCAGAQAGRSAPPRASRARAASYASAAGALAQHRARPSAGRGGRASRRMSVGGTGSFARRVEVLDAHQPAAAAAASVEEAADGGDQRTEMERPARGRRKATAVGRRDLSGTSRRGRRTAFRVAHAVPAPRRSVSPPGRASRRFTPIGSPVSRQKP